MEQIRKTLNALMGTDRDAPLKEQLLKRKHFDDNEICKYFLLGFCPQELFPFLKNFGGRCPKVHDNNCKINFENSLHRESFQVKYEGMLLDFLKRIVADIDNKMKKCLDRIEISNSENKIRNKRKACP